MEGRISLVITKDYNLFCRFPEQKIQLYHLPPGDKSAYFSYSLSQCRVCSSVLACYL